MGKKWKEANYLPTEENLYLILNNLDEGIHIVNREGKTIVYNTRVSQIDGLTPEEVLGKNIFKVYPSLTLETSTLMQTLKTGKTVNDFQQTFINNRGEKITTVNKTVPIKFKNGEIGAMEISRDITQLENLVNIIGDLETNLTNKEIINDTKLNKKNKGNTTYSFRDIIRKCPQFKNVLEDAIKAAGSDSSVLIYGETGTGKELFAQSIHSASKRGNKPFVAQNCAALPGNLLEGLLFGTEKGGFTGAKNRPGLFEQAEGGTVLLDEINSMDLALQAKLLRVLQENKVRRVGGQKEIPVDIRIISTMNKHPDQAFAGNELRKDLFYRLNVIFLNIPPLRERKDDIELLTNYFINDYNNKFNKSIKGLNKDVCKYFREYRWPGNVRELQHIIECVFNMIQNNDIIRFEDLPGYFKERLRSNETSFDFINQTFENKKLPALDDVLNGLELKLIKKALKQTGGNISAAARKLSISRQSLQYKINKYEIQII